jgi:hypothetical protein
LINLIFLLQTQFTVIEFPRRKGRKLSARPLKSCEIRNCKVSTTSQARPTEHRGKGAQTFENHIICLLASLFPFLFAPNKVIVILGKSLQFLPSSSFTLCNQLDVFRGANFKKFRISPSRGEGKSFRKNNFAGKRQTRQRWIFFVRDRKNFPSSPARAEWRKKVFSTHCMCGIHLFAESAGEIV